MPAPVRFRGERGDQRDAELSCRDVFAASLTCHRLHRHYIDEAGAAPTAPGRPEPAAFEPKVPAAPMQQAAGMRNRQVVKWRAAVQAAGDQPRTRRAMNSSTDALNRKLRVARVSRRLDPLQL